MRNVEPNLVRNILFNFHLESGFWNSISCTKCIYIIKIINFCVTNINGVIPFHFIINVMVLPSPVIHLVQVSPFLKIFSIPVGSNNYTTWTNKKNDYHPLFLELRIHICWCSWKIYRKKGFLRWGVLLFYHIELPIGISTSCPAACL